MTGGTMLIKKNEYYSNTTETFKDLLLENNFTDVTLVCSDLKQISAHKIILSSASEFFKGLFLNNPKKDLLVYLKGISFRNLESLMKFIYLGQVEVDEEELQSFLGAGKELEVKGLNNELTHDATINLEMDESPENDTAMTQDEFIHLLSSEGIKEEKKTMDEVSKVLSPKVSIKIADFSNDAITISDEEVFIDGTSSEGSDCDVRKHVPYGAESATEFSFDIKPIVPRNIKSEGLNTLKCKECHQKFASAGALINHRRSKHEGISYSCEFCDYRNGQAGNLRKHVIRHHTK